MQEGVEPSFGGLISPVLPLNYCTNICLNVKLLYGQNSRFRTWDIPLKGFLFTTEIRLELAGVEPATSSLQGTRSFQLNYNPK